MDVFREDEEDFDDDDSSSEEPDNREFSENSSASTTSTSASSTSSDPQTVSSDALQGPLPSFASSFRQSSQHKSLSPSSSSTSTSPSTSSSSSSSAETIITHHSVSVNASSQSIEVIGCSLCDCEEFAPSLFLLTEDASQICDYCGHNANNHADYQQDLAKGKSNALKSAKPMNSSYSVPHQHSSIPFSEQQFLQIQQQKDAEAAFLSVIQSCAVSENLQGFVNEIHSVGLNESLCEKILRTILDIRMKDESLANFLHNLLVLHPVPLDKLSFALAACAAHGALHSIRLLISQHKADVNFPYSSGQGEWFLPLFAALEDVEAPNMIEVVTLMLSLGGNPMKCSPDGMSALELLDLKFIIGCSGQPPPAALKIKEIFLQYVRHQEQTHFPPPVPSLPSTHHNLANPSLTSKRMRSDMNPLSQSHPYDGQHEEMITNTRLYLHCPEDEKEAAKSLGARWDGQRRQYFIPPGSSISPFESWLPPLQGEWDSGVRDERRFLVVPDSDKDIVNSYGAQYDPVHHRWFVPPSMALAQFEPWLPKTDIYGPPSKRMKLDHLH